MPQDTGQRPAHAAVKYHLIVVLWLYGACGNNGTTIKFTQPLDTLFSSNNVQMWTVFICLSLLNKPVEMGYAA